MVESRLLRLSPGRFILVLLPMTFSVGCTTSAGPVRVEPPNPQIANADTTSRQRLISVVAPIEPDRPDVTNGTNIVEVGLLQLEAGVQHARLGTQRSVGTPLTVRIGVFEWLEA